MDWINRISVNNPTAADKMRMLRYYIGEQCVCGKSKKGYRWDCLQCSKCRNAYIEDYLAVRCSNHIFWATELLKDHMANATHANHITGSTDEPRLGPGI